MKSTIGSMNSDARSRGRLHHLLVAMFVLVLSSTAKGQNEKLVVDWQEDTLRSESSYAVTPISFDSSASAVIWAEAAPGFNSTTFFKKQSLATTTFPPRVSSLSAIFPSDGGLANPIAGYAASLDGDWFRIGLFFDRTVVERPSGLGFTTDTTCRVEKFLVKHDSDNSETWRVFLDSGQYELPGSQDVDDCIEQFSRFQRSGGFIKDELFTNNDGDAVFLDQPFSLNWSEYNALSGTKTGVSWSDRWPSESPGPGFSGTSVQYVYPNGDTLRLGVAAESYGSPLRPFDRSFSRNSVLARFAKNGGLVWHTYFGTGNPSSAHVALDGSIFVSGSPDQSWGSPLRLFAGFFDASVTKFSFDGTYLWHTFLGGSQEDRGSDVAVDPDGRIFVLGKSKGEWGTLGDSRYLDRGDVFVAQLTESGQYVRHIFFGRDGEDTPGSITGDPQGNLYVQYRTFINNPSGSSNEEVITKLYRNLPPSISVSDLSYVEGDTDAIISTDAVVTNSQGDREWDIGASLRVQITQGAEQSDRLYISTLGNFSRSGSDLLYQGVEVGRQVRDPASGGNPMIVNFRSAATTAVVNELVRSIGFGSNSTTPSEVPREVSFTLLDKHGGAATAVATVSVENIINDSSLTLTGSATGAPVGSGVTLTATLPDLPLLTGSVSFFNDGVALPACDSITVVNRQAECVTDDLTQKVHSFTAQFSGDSNYAPSTSASFDVTVPTPNSIRLETFGSGAGTVSVSPQDDCIPLCGGGSYAPNTVVTLTPVAAEGSEFAGWVGSEACSGTGSCTLTVSEAITVSAVFNQISSFGTDTDRSICNPSGNEAVVSNEDLSSTTIDCVAKSLVELGPDISVTGSGEINAQAPRILLVPPLEVGANAAINARAVSSSVGTAATRWGFVDTGNSTAPLFGGSTDSSQMLASVNPSTGLLSGITLLTPGYDFTHIAVDASGRPKSISRNDMSIFFVNVTSSTFDAVVVSENQNVDVIRNLTLPNATSNLALPNAIPVAPARKSLSLARSSMIMQPAGLSSVDLLRAVSKGFSDADAWLDIVGAVGSALTTDVGGALAFVIKKEAQEYERVNNSPPSIGGILVPPAAISTAINLGLCTLGSPASCVSAAIDTVSNYTNLALFVMETDWESASAQVLGIDRRPPALTLFRPRSPVLIKTSAVGETFEVTGSIVEDTDQPVSVYIDCPDTVEDIVPVRGPASFFTKADAISTDPWVYKFSVECPRPNWVSQDVQVSSLKVAAFDDAGNDARRSLAVQTEIDLSVKAETVLDRATEGRGPDRGLFRISRDGEIGLSFRVRFETLGTAERGVDYDLLARGSNQTFVVKTDNELFFAPAADEIEIRVEAIQDNSFDPSETVQLRLLPSTSNDFVPYTIVAGQSISPAVTIAEVGTCNEQQAQGSDAPDLRTFNVGRGSGTLSLTYEAFGVEDRWIISKNGALLRDTGCVSGGSTINIPYTGSTNVDNFIDVEVAPKCDPADQNSGTSWNYSLSCN